MAYGVRNINAVFVTPAKAGVQGDLENAGALDSRVRGNDAGH